MEVRGKSVGTVVVGALSCLSAGSLLSLSIFTPTYNALFKITELQGTLVAGSGLAGFALSFPVGCLFSRLSAMWMCVVSCVISTLAFLLLWSATKAVAFYTGKIWLLGLYSFMAGHGIAYLYQTALSVILRNVPQRYWGMVVGCLHSVLSLAALGVDAIELFGLPTILPSSIFIYLGLIVLANLCGIAFLRLDRIRPRPERSMSEDVRTLTIGAIEYAPSDAGSSMASDDEDVPTSGRPTPTPPPPVDRRRHRSGAVEVPSCSDMLPAAFSWSFLSIAGTFMFGVSAAMSVAWNLTRMLKWVEDPDKPSAAVILSVYAGFATLFAILTGVFRDLTLSRVPQRNIVTLSTVAISIVACIVAVLPEIGGMWPVYAATAGIAFGSLWCSIPVLIADRFTVKRFTFMWCTVLTVTVLWSIAIQVINISLQDAERRGELEEKMSTRLSVLIQCVLGVCSVICSLNLPNI